MTNETPSPPEFGQPLPACHPSSDTLELLSLRRSSSAALLAEPGPTASEMDRLLTIAARVPDHRRVYPFRFLVFEGDARNGLADIFADAAEKAGGEGVPSPDAARTLALRAPSVVVVVSSVNLAHKTPEWEQILVSGAVCQNFLIASSAMGFGAQWLTEWVAFNETVLAGLGLKEHERVAGVMYVGTASENPKERARPDMSALVTRWPTT